MALSATGKRNNALSGCHSSFLTVGASTDASGFPLDSEGVLTAPDTRSRTDLFVPMAIPLERTLHPFLLIIV
jgi:hypothetical protein